MSTLVIVPCGSQKIWSKEPWKGPTVAILVYTGLPFKINSRYARYVGNRWVILSAKYGYIDPYFYIPQNYNVSFNKPTEETVSVEVLSRQIKEMKLLNYCKIIGLGGKEYMDRIKRSFQKFRREVEFPFAGLTIGRSLSAVKNATDQAKGGYW